LDLDHPLALVTPTIDGDVLALLARTEEEFTPGEIQQQLGYASVQGIRNVLARLVTQGIVVQERVRGVLVFSICSEHLATPYLQALAHLADELADRVSDQMARWLPPPRFACLSQRRPVPPDRPATRGRGAPRRSPTPECLQLLIVPPDDLAKSLRPAWTAGVKDLQRRVTEWTGTKLVVRQLDVAGLTRSFYDGEEFLDQSINEGRVLFGRREFLELVRLGRSTEDDQRRLLEAAL